MGRKKFRLVLDYVLHCSLKPTAGFTLIEVLVSAVVGVFVVIGLLHLLIDLLRTDQLDTASNETQREIASAVDYIAADLREAVYVYEGECLGSSAQGSPGSSTYCPGLQGQIGGLPSSGFTPVLAFWKIEKIPYKSSDTLPTCGTTSTDTDSNCRGLQLRLNSYTFVMYALKNDSSSTWQGPARIVRFQLREYTPNSFAGSTLTTTTGYTKPNFIDRNNPSNNVTFQSWPCTVSASCPTSTNQPNYQEFPDNPPSNAQFDQYNAMVLTDFVDNSPNSTSTPTCPAGNSFNPITQSTLSTYSTTPLNITTDSSANKSFYACVRRPLASNNIVQDVSIFLRGNALKRANLTFSASTDRGNLSYFPTVKTQSQLRGVSNRNPDNIIQ